MVINYNLYFNLLFLFILGFGFLVGLIRGFKKSLYSLVVMTIFYVIFFLTINWAANIFYSMTIPGLGSLLEIISPELKNATSLDKIIPIILSMNSESLGVISQNTEFIQFTNSVTLLFVKIVYTVFYFTVGYIIYRIITLIIRVIFFKTKQRENEIVPKRHGLGALIGLAHGALSLFFLLIFLGGTMSIADSTLKLLPKDTNTADLGDMVTAYKQNAIVKVVESVKVQDKTKQSMSFNNYLFDRIFSFNYRNKQISVRKELTIVVELNDKIQFSQFKTTNDLSTISGNEVREFFNTISKSDLFMAALPLGAEIAASYVDTSITIPKEDLYAIDWDKEVLQLGEVAAVTFDLVNAAGLLEENPNLETVTFNGDNVRDLFDSLSESELANLAAYKALVPILAKLGSQANTIITVPEGLVWEYEFKAIGLVAGDIVDTGITVKDMNSGNPTQIMSALSDLDYTVVLNSKIISQALINILSGTANVDGLDTLVVPENIVWYDTVDNEGNVTENGELRNILVAFNEIMKDANDFDFNNITINVISNFTDNTIDAVFESRILVATVSSLLKDMDLGNTPLLIPDSVYDENHYINKSELSSLVKSAKIVITTLSCDVEGTCGEIGYDFSKALNLTDDNINTIFTSDIISSTLGNMIISQSGDVLVVPNKTKTTIYVNDVEQLIINKEEVKKLFKAVSTLGVSDLNNMNFDASIVKKLASSEDPKLLDQTKANKLFASDIIHATLSKMLLDLTIGENNVLVVPYYDENETAIRYIDEVEYISTTELNAILEAVLQIDINDFNAIQTLDISLIFNNTSALLNSSIVQATFSDQLISLGDSIVTIPDVDVEMTPVRKTVGDVEKQTEYITKIELENIIASLELLGITDINSFNGTFDLTIFNDDLTRDNNENTLLKSASIHATISKKLIELDDVDSLLIVPMYSQDGEVEANRIRKQVGLTNYVVKDEIKHLINAFLVMNYTDFDNFGTNIESTRFFSERDIILQSSTLQATLSDKIINETGGNLIVPDINVNNNQDVRIVMSDVTYIELNEMNALLSALDQLALTNFDLIDFNPLNVFSVDFNILLASASIQATVSDVILDNAVVTAPYGTPTLIVPEFFREDIVVDTLLNKQIKQSELNNLLTSLKLLGVTEFNGSMSASVITTMSDENLTTVFNSGSIHITIDNMLKGNTYINIPDEATGNYYNLTNITTPTELKAFIKAASIISTDFTTASFDYSVISSLSNEQKDIVLDSMIVRNVLTDQLEPMMTLHPDFPIDSSFYENGDMSSFYTENGINLIIAHLLSHSI